MPLKLESFSHETTCLHATVISTVSVRVAVTRDATITDFVGTIIVWGIITVITIIMHLLISQY